MKFVLNNQNLHEINVNPDGVALWKRLAKGLTGGVIGNNDVIDQTAYLDGDGFGTTTVTGGQKITTFAGHRFTGDPAQDYIVGVSNLFGAGRETQYRFTNAVGEGFIGECTVASIESGGGDANAKTDIGFEVHINGAPVQVPQAIAPALTMVVAVGTVSGTTSFTATPDGDNTLAYKLQSADIGEMYVNQYIDGSYIGYTSGADIKALEGQYLVGVELDENKRLVKINSHLLITADILA